jgi:hypothetical protein
MRVMTIALLIQATMATPADISAEAKASFDAFGLRPYPRVIITDIRLERNEYARAVRYESGREELWIRQPVKKDGLRVIIDHESAHLRAWRDYGLTIESHGPHWLRTCRRFAQSIQSCNERR